MRRKSVQSLYGEREMKHRGQAEFGRRQERPQEQASKSHMQTGSVTTEKLIVNE
jgi:hypothetical protein